MKSRGPAQQPDPRISTACPITGDAHNTVTLADDPWKHVCECGAYTVGMAVDFGDGSAGFPLVGTRTVMPLQMEQLVEAGMVAPPELRASLEHTLGRKIATEEQITATKVRGIISMWMRGDRKYDTLIRLKALMSRDGWLDALAKANPPRSLMRHLVIERDGKQRVVTLDMRGAQKPAVS